MTWTGFLGGRVSWVDDLDGFLGWVTWTSFLGGWFLGWVVPWVGDLDRWVSWVGNVDGLLK